MPTVDVKLVDVVKTFGDAVAVDHIDLEVVSGEFFGPSGFMEQRGAPKRVKAWSKAYDTETARRLWKVSEELTGVTYNFE